MRETLGGVVRALVRSLVSCGLMLGLSAAQTICGSGTGVCIQTWRQDINLTSDSYGTTGSPCSPYDAGGLYSHCAYRTGENLSESTLLPTNLSASNFGQLCSAGLDGQVYAQPLVMTNVKINNVTYPIVVYVVTQGDKLYAIDGDPADGNTPCYLISSLSLVPNTPSGQYPVKCGTTIDNCATIDPQIGALGTPVININSDGSATLYVVRETETGDSPSNYAFYHHLHAVNIQTMQELSASPVQITVSGDTSFSKKHIQRPGLLYVPSLLNGLSYDTVYLAFSMIDGYGNTPPYGAIFSYSAANAPSPLSQVALLRTSQGTSSTDEGGGIWMDGAGLALGLDSSSGHPFIYVSTANGTWNPSASPVPDYGDSLLKVSPTDLSVKDYFTPADQCYRDCNDSDYGSGGVILLPDDEAGSNSYAINGEKEGGLWFLNRASPGECVDSFGHSCPMSCTCSNPTPNKCIAQSSTIAVYWTGSSPPNSCGASYIHNTPAFWESSSTEYLFVAPYSQPMTQYKLYSSPRNPPVQSQVQGSVTFHFGATPVISANGNSASDAIVWAIQVPDHTPKSTTPGVLYAFEATNIATTLYSSNNTSCSADAINPATKHSVPVVANGYVYVGTESANTTQQTSGQGTFYIFGLRTCS